MELLYEFCFVSDTYAGRRNDGRCLNKITGIIFHFVKKEKKT